MTKFYQKFLSVGSVCLCALLLSACANTKTVTVAKPATSQYKTHKGSISDPINAISSLSEHQRKWRGTRYRLGGTSRSGIDCSAFTQVTYRDLFGISLPRTTTEQAQKGVRVAKKDLQPGDLVFFKTGRGPNGKHVGVYVKNGQFMHASTKQGVTYSNLNSAYWSRTFWQARRL